MLFLIFLRNFLLIILRDAVRQRFALFHLFFFSAMIVIALVSYYLFHPLAVVSPPEQEDRYAAVASSILHKMDIPVDTVESLVTLSVQKDVLSHTQRVHGLKYTNDMIREGLPVYLYNYRTARKININGETEVRLSNKGMVLPTKIDFLIAPDNKIHSFSLNEPDSILIPDSGRTYAENTAYGFLSAFTPFGTRLQNQKVTDTFNVFIPTQTDSFRSRNNQVYKLNGRFHDGRFNISYAIAVTVTGSKITQFSATPTNLELAAEDNELFIQVSIVAWVILLIILYIIYGIRRFRAYELGIKNAMIWGLLGAIAFAYVFLIDAIRGPEFWGMVFGFLFLFLFMGLILLAVWSISESTGREIYRKKFFQIDLIRNGYFEHSATGRSIVRGISFGAAVLVSYLLITASLATTGILALVPPQNLVKILFFAELYPANAFAYSVTSTFYVIPIFLIFLPLIFYQGVKKKSLAILISAIAWMLAPLVQVTPIPALLIVQFLVSCGILWLLFKYDVLTAGISFFTFVFWEAVASFFFIGSEVMFYTAAGFTVVFLAAFVYGLRVQFTKDPEIDDEGIAPTYAKHITERQRLKGEIEIAHSVQFSLLPKSIPSHDGLQFGSYCLPAEEVGGDYYDFLPFSNKRTGVMIGDVAGKGIKGAFYMTLSKGFITASAQHSESPATILKSVNALFYRYVERKTFLTIALGIFDPSQKTATISCAGHLPVFHFRAENHSISEINPKGIAIGMDKGELFDTHIEELGVHYQENDLFIFYTDGITEAINSKNEEYGTERFKQFILQNHALSPNEFIEKLVLEIKKFSRKKKQRDDITLLIVKC